MLLSRLTIAGNTTDHKNTFPEEPGGWGDGGQGSTAIGPEPIAENSSGGSEDEKKEGREEGRKEEEEEEEEEEDDDDEDTREWIEWAQGVPVSARFVSSKVKLNHGGVVTWSPENVGCACRVHTLQPKDSSQGRC